MDRSTFEAADLVVDEIAAKLDEVLDSDQFAAIRVLLAHLSEKVGSEYSVNLNVTVDVFDAERSNALPLLNMGLSTSKGEPPYKTHGDSTSQKYVVNGEIQVVPHDRCPRCFGLWDFKLNHPSCFECGVTMGREVKLLLDTDVCPFCEEGRVSLTNPVCANVVKRSILGSLFGAELGSIRIERRVDSSQEVAEPECSPDPWNQPISDSLGVLFVARQFIPQGLVFPARTHDQDQARHDGGNQCPE